MKKVVLIILIVLSSCKKDRLYPRYTTWQSSPAEETIIRKTLKELKESRPELKWNFQPIPGNYPEKIQLMLGTGNAPDVFWLKGDTAPAYMSFAVLEPLDKFITNDNAFDNNDFFPVFKDAFVYNGKSYGIAKDFNSYVLFYNKDMFEEAGLYNPPRNWEELRDYAQQLTRDVDNDGNIDQFGFVIEPSIDVILPFVFQNKGELISKSGEIKVDRPEFAEALNFVHSMYTNNVATIPADQGAGWMGDVFSRKQCAMVISGAWIIPYLKDNAPDLKYGVSELPQGKTKGTLAFTVGMVIPSQSNHKEDSWKIISFLTGKRGMKTWTESGIALPTRKSVALKTGVYKDSVLSTFMNSVEYAKLYKIPLKGRWFDESQAAMQGIFYKKKNIEQTLKELAITLRKYKL